VADLEDPRVTVLVRLAVLELAVGLRLGRDPLVLREDSQDFDLRITGHEEPADRREQLVDDLVAAARDAGAGNALSGRLPAAVGMDLRAQRLEIAAAQRLEKHADEPLVGRFVALGHVDSSPRPLSVSGRYCGCRVRWCPR